MKRVLILGSGASGKTTFAKALAARTGLPLVHLDSLYWSAGWRSAPMPKFQRRLSAALRRPSWIIDGSYFGTLPQRLKRADTVIYLDYSRWLCLTRLLKRRFQYRSGAGRVRPGMPPDCPERIYFSYVRWLLRYPSVERPRVLAAISKCRPEPELILLSGPGAAEKYLLSLGAKHVR